jgi:hypothetical protein
MDSVQFTSQVLFDSEVADGYMKHYVPIPDSVAKSFEEAGHKHVEGKLNNTAFRRVLHLRDDGSTCLKFGESWLDGANLKVNMPVTVELAPDLQPNRVDLPIELLAELQREPQIMEAFAELSINKQKTLAYGVERAKKLETRIRRSQAIVEELRESLEGDGD